MQTARHARISLSGKKKAKKNRGTARATDQTKKPFIQGSKAK
jgi:hypothetical protein